MRQRGVPELAGLGPTGNLRAYHKGLGLFDATLPGFLHEHPGTVGFMHIDSDLYSSAKTVLDTLTPRLKPGAVIVFDDYFNYPEWEDGEYKAFMEFIEKTGLTFDFIGYHRNAQNVAVILREKTK